MAYLPEDLAALAASQHSAVTNQQVRHHLSEGRMRALVGAGVLVDSGQRGVYLLAGAPRTRRQELAALLLRLGGAAAADHTALALHQLDGFELRPPYHVAVSSRRRLRSPGCQLHRTDLADRERVTVHGLACMAVPLALVRLARPGGVETALSAPDGTPIIVKGRRLTVRAATDEALRTGLTTRAELLSVAEAHPTDPGAAAFRRRLRDGTFAPENDAERALGALFRPGDPQPVFQMWVLPDVRADVALPPARMTLEYHSREWHLQPGDQDRDAARSLKLADAGILEIAVTSGMLRHQTERTRRQVLSVYARRLGEGVDPLVPHEPPAWAS